MSNDILYMVVVEMVKLGVFRNFKLFIYFFIKVF